MDEILETLQRVKPLLDEISPYAKYSVDARSCPDKCIVSGEITTSVKVDIRVYPNRLWARVNVRLSFSATESKAYTWNGTCSTEVDMPKNGLEVMALLLSIEEKD